LSFSHQRPKRSAQRWALSGAPEAAALWAAGREPGPAWQGSGREDESDNCPAAKLGLRRGE